MWKRLSSKIVFKSKWLTLREDKVELPSKKVTEYLIRESIGFGATIILKNKEGKILVQKEYAYPLDGFVYAFPGGQSLPGESKEEAVKRELMEEAGFEVLNCKLIGSYLNDCRRSDYETYVFVGDKYKINKLDSDDEEIIETEWLSEREIEEKIENGEIKNHHLLSAWSIYKSKYHE